MKRKAMFSIHLIEDETGLVTVFAEMAGMGDKCYDIGSEIMQNLHEAEKGNPELLNVTGLRSSEYFQ